MRLGKVFIVMSILCLFLVCPLHAAASNIGESSRPDIETCSYGNPTYSTTVMDSFHCNGTSYSCATSWY